MSQGRRAAQPRAGRLRGARGRAGSATTSGAFAVTAGHGLDALVAALEAEHDDYSAILAKALADRLAEAFAERLHERVRTRVLGLRPGRGARQRGADARAVPGHPARRRAIRPAPTTPRSERSSTLLEAERGAGITLTESFAMLPAASVSGWYFWRPEAQYFGVGKIGRDQVEDYARRKGMDVADGGALARAQPGLRAMQAGPHPEDTAMPDSARRCWPTAGCTSSTARWARCSTARASSSTSATTS